MNEPTDNELDIVLSKHWPAFATVGTLPLIWIRAAFREAIAKWGAPQPAVQQGDADVEGAIKSAFFRFFGAGAERDWHTEPGGWFIEGYRAAHPAAPVAQGDAEQRQLDAKHAAIYRWMLRNVADAWNIIDNWCLDAEAGTDELHDALAARAQANEGDQHGTE